MTADMADVVRAAGGLVWRPRGTPDPNDFEIVVVHRPRYDDWSLPKGKADSEDEDDETCALREVEEETGLRCVIDGDLGSTTYTDRKGRPKVVRYFLMRAENADDLHMPQTDEEVPEVDEVRWMTGDDALLLLTYERDRELVAGFTPPQA